MNIDLFKVREDSDPELDRRPCILPDLEDRKTLKKYLADCTREIDRLQYRMYAENRQSLLVVLQGMDASGKDSAVRRLMSGVNPQGVIVSSFKHPSALELDYNYLWRHYAKLPQKGTIAIFNRSYYENVLITRVHPELLLAERMPGIDSVGKVDEQFWLDRFEQIRKFERILAETGTHIVKFYLHLSRAEQKRRFLDRIERKEKHWKFSSSDIRERKFWNEYMHAYSQALRHTSCDHAPWYVIPADSKPFARLAIGRVILDTLQGMQPQFPAVAQSELDMIAAAREELLAE